MRHAHNRYGKPPRSHKQEWNSHSHVDL
jgi:hypothetical protein